MRIKLRSKHGGRLEVVGEDGQPIEGVIAVELVASAPDFVPRVRVMQHLAITADVDAEIASTASEKIGENFTKATIKGANTEARTTPADENHNSLLSDK